jgi:hypothetical protein
MWCYCPLSLSSEPEGRKIPRHCHAIMMPVGPTPGSLRVRVAFTGRLRVVSDLTQRPCGPRGLRCCRLHSHGATKPERSRALFRAGMLRLPVAFYLSVA